MCINKCKKMHKYDTYSILYLKINVINIKPIQFPFKNK